MVGSNGVRLKTLGVSEALLVPGTRVERERVHDIQQIARAMLAQEMLEHEAVIERPGAGCGQVQDLALRLALHLRVEVGEIQRHGVRGAKNHPVDCAVLRSCDLEKGIAASGLNHELLS